MSKFSNLLITFFRILLPVFLFLWLTNCISTPKKTETYQKQTIAEPESDSGYEPQQKVQVVREKNTIKKLPEVKTTTPGQGDSATSAPPRKIKKYKFDWPVWEARMSRGFLPKGTNRRKRPHKGIDLAAQRGTAVMASNDGVVIYTGKKFKGYGKMVMIESPDNWATLYGHLDKIIVHEGQNVKQGDVIGALGNTGRSSGPHLHFEIRRLDGPIDPLPYLPAGNALTNDVDDPTAPNEEE